MSQDPHRIEQDDKPSQSRSLAIVVALIGSIGVIAAALIGSIDNIIELFSTPVSSPSPSSAATIVNIPTFTPQESQVNSLRVIDFNACLEACDGSNDSEYFPEGIVKIYLHWSFENIPQGSNYTRIWKNNGREWIRYDCQWDGPENGTTSTSLREPGGLHSGLWEVNIIVDHEVLLNEQFIVQGSWDYWSPAGKRSTCE